MAERKRSGPRGASRATADQPGIVFALCVSVALAGFAACASNADEVQEIALPAPSGTPSLIEYPRVPDIVAEACREAIDRVGWGIASMGRAFDYRGNAYVDYRVIRADGRHASARCVYDGQTGRSLIYAVSPPAGPVIQYPNVPDLAGDACRAEIQRLGWSIASVGKAVGYGGDVVVDYRVNSSSGDASLARCFYDGSTSQARVQF